MRRLGNMTAVAGVALALAACSPTMEEPSDLPPGTDPAPAQSAGAPPAEAPVAQGPECTAQDVQVAGEPGQKPTITIPDTCSPPKSLVSEDLVPGTGAEATPGSTIEANYLLVTWSDKVVKDNSFDRGETFPLENLGQAQVIDGWNEGLVGMKEGARRLLIVPPEKGYGPGGQGIKPNETLAFVVDAVKVTPAGA
ncbi:peptidylprolyl isomerase [Amycolatopsis antarctica]|uniref:Peptidyl-prolyl cis-trans isomerase n=1 Tax=Amycolatopsis antarctica TaxID=1854586 RepID=A0A263D354_9PSEU|nr:FKBP-type peptidyl-prolyl cis-trans isomerase [Amycolatopsis antarctica]OZM72508.1 peptidylprolyl isomerase [Amycolatopsis antarctica]